MTTGVRLSSRGLAAVGAFTAAAVLLAGCGGSSDGASASTPVASSSGGNTQMLLQKQELTVLGQSIAYPKKTPARITSSILTLEPGQETGWHKQQTPLYAYVLDGTVTVEYDAGVIKEYPAGTALMEAQDAWLNGTNKGDAPVHILMVNLGAKGVKNTVKRTP